MNLCKNIVLYYTHYAFNVYFIVVEFPLILLLLLENPDAVVKTPFCAIIERDFERHMKPHSHL